MIRVLDIIAVNFLLLFFNIDKKSFIDELGINFIRLIFTSIVIISLIIFLLS
jgi:hypothetical protein